MQENFQQTISQPVTFEGIGLHSGKISKVKLIPSEEDNGIFYIPGFLPLAKRVYGENDPRVEFIETLYEKNKIKPGPAEPYYINEGVYRSLSTKQVRSQLSVKEYDIPSFG